MALIPPVLSGTVRGYPVCVAIMQYGFYLDDLSLLWSLVAQGGLSVVQEVRRKAIVTNRL